VYINVVLGKSQAWRKGMISRYGIGGPTLGWLDRHVYEPFNGVGDQRLDDSILIFCSNQTRRLAL
jgi:hypothetical protein